MATESITIEVDDYTQEWSKSGGSSHTEKFEDGTISRRDWEAIPEGATITRVSVTGKITVNSSLTITMEFGDGGGQVLIPCTLSGNYMKGWTVSGECDGASFPPRDELIKRSYYGFYGECEQKSSMTSGDFEASFTDFAVTIEYTLGGGIAGTVTIGGTPKEISTVYANVGGTWKGICKKYINVDGVWKVSE